MGQGSILSRLEALEKKYEAPAEEVAAVVGGADPDVVGRLEKVEAVVDKIVGAFGGHNAVETAAAEATPEPAIPAPPGTEPFGTVVAEDPPGAAEEPTATFGDTPGFVAPAT